MKYTVNIIILFLLSLNLASLWIWPGLEEPWVLGSHKSREGPFWSSPCWCSYVTCLICLQFVPNVYFFFALTHDSASRVIYSSQSIDLGNRRGSMPVLVVVEDSPNLTFTLSNNPQQRAIVTVMSLPSLKSLRREIIGLRVIWLPKILIMDITST